MTRPLTLAVDATSVYWLTSGGGLYQAPKYGGAVATLAREDGASAAGAIALDATSVYYGYGGIFSAPKGGGKEAALTQSQVAVDVTNGFVLDSTSLYFGGVLYASQTPVIMKMPKSGGPASVLTKGTPLAAPTGGAVPPIAVDASYVYWGGFAGGLFRAPLAGGPSITLVADAFPVDCIAIDSASVYWADDGVPGIVSVPKSGGTPLTLASGPEAPGFFALDETDVYFTDAASGVIGHIPKTGGPTVTVAHGSNPLGIVLDETRAYWADWGDHSIRSVPK